MQETPTRPAKKRRPETAKAVLERTEAPVKRFTIEEVAATYKTTPRLVRSWVTEGKLKGSKIGKRFFFKESDLEEMESRSPAYTKDELAAMSSRD